MEEEEEEYLTFQKFRSPDEAGPLMALLESAGIEYWMEDVSPEIDLTFAGNLLDKEYRIKIKESDFQRANEVLDERAAETIDQIPEDYYLYDFSDKELLELIEKPDEWSKNDYFLSRKILNDRGYSITDEHIAELKEKRLAELRHPEKVPLRWLIAGFVFALAGGIIGIFLGWFYMTFKKTDPLGKRVYAYDQSSRKYATFIFVLGVISIIVWNVLFWFGFIVIPK